MDQQSTYGNEIHSSCIQNSFWKKEIISSLGAGSWQKQNFKNHFFGLKLHKYDCTIITMMLCITFLDMTYIKFKINVMFLFSVPVSMKSWPQSLRESYSFNTFLLLLSAPLSEYALSIVTFAHLHRVIFSFFLALVPYSVSKTFHQSTISSSHPFFSRLLKYFIVSHLDSCSSLPFPSHLHLPFNLFFMLQRSMTSDYLKDKLTKPIK